MALKREKFTLTKSSLVRSEEARSTRASWGAVPMLPTYSAIEKQLCQLDYGLDAKCT